jgi:hypothetical protein
MDNGVWKEIVYLVIADALLALGVLEKLLDGRVVGKLGAHRRQGEGPACRLGGHAAASLLPLSS